MNETTTREQELAAFTEEIKAKNERIKKEMAEMKAKLEQMKEEARREDPKVYKAICLLEKCTPEERRAFREWAENELAKMKAAEE